MEILSGDRTATFDGDQIAVATQVARVVVFDDIKLASISAQLGATRNQERPARFVVDTTPTYVLSDDLVTLTVNIPFSVLSKDDAIPDAVLATVNAEYVLSYHLTVPPPPEESRDRFFSAFARINSVFNAWPFMRETLHGITAKMGLRPQLLPVFRILATPKAAPPDELPAPPQSQGQLSPQATD